MNEHARLYDDAVTLLKELISIPSFSREEHGTAGAISRFLALRSIEHSWVANNIYALNKHFDPSKPTLLLNSHHDTVKPNKGYTLDPFSPIEKDGRLYGLGSNDAGGALVSLIAAFLHFHDRPNMTYNVVVAATAEEEISGPNGIEYTLNYIPKPDCAIVGEPTLLNLAIAERGLMVLDAVAKGRSGHAARNEGESALNKAVADINWINTYAFPKQSDLLGPVKMSVTVIETDNKAHNVVPDSCRFVIDVRVNEQYSFEQVLETIGQHVQSEIKPRSTRMRSSLIPQDHPLVMAGTKLGRTVYGSPTTSDKALMPCPALKLGPGDSARSHTADEYIHLHEIRDGIELYINMIEQLVNPAS
jgi:acetylornithine deacetylase